MKLHEYADDKRPAVNDEEYPLALSDYSEETEAQWAGELEEIINLEQGIVSENTLLKEGVVFDNDLAEENMENDYFDQDRNDI